MNEKISFWSHFEELSDYDSIHDSDSLKTNTRQREEPDQLAATTLVATKTKTGNREELDQECLSGYASFERSIKPMATGTFTEAREEPDQDESCRGYAAIKKRST